MPTAKEILEKLDKNAKIRLADGHVAAAKARSFFATVRPTVEMVGGMLDRVASLETEALQAEAMLELEASREEARRMFGEEPAPEEIFYVHDLLFNN